MTKKKLNSGDVVHVKAEHFRALKSLSDRIQVSQVLVSESGRQLSESGNELWKTIHELYPETVDHIGNYDSKNNTITLLYPNIDK